MLPLIATGVAAIGIFVTLIVTDFNKYEEERDNINVAQKISQQNNAVNKIINIDSAVNAENINTSLSNSKLLANKPLSYKIVSFSSDENEKEIINKYSTAVKKLLGTNPNGDVDCRLLSSTEIITLAECEQVHDKEYDFYHKTTEGNVAYTVSNEKIGEYVSEMEANRYNLKVENVSTDNKIVLDKNHIESSSNFLTKKNLENKEKEITRIKTYIENGDYLLASAEIYNMKKNNNQYTPLVSELYMQLLDDVETNTENATEESEEYQTKLKIQSELLKLTKTSNILANVDTSKYASASKLINDVVENYAEVQSYNSELVTTQGTTVASSLPTIVEYKESLKTISSNLVQFK